MRVFLSLFHMYLLNLLSTTYAFKLPANSDESPSVAASLSSPNSFPDTASLPSFLTSADPSVKTVSATQPDSLPNPDGFLTSFLAQFDEEPAEISLPAALYPSTYKVHRSVCPWKMY